MVKSSTRTEISDNTITNANSSGIAVNATSEFLTINRNKLVNCGLTGAQAVILVGNEGPNDGSVAIGNNNYRGNAANLQFYIRSYPPTTLTNNTTTTLLPSQVGPGP